MMEKLSSTCHEKEDQMDLPPGFRFHPTDEELITHYLLNKVVDYTFVAKPIAEVDLNKIEPWDLPRMAKTGEKVWYFYSVRDKKYPTGLRTNRATAVGYWKATGKDKEIFKARSLIGMKKTLVFYTGRAPKGAKTNWVIHEYRLEGQFAQKNLPKSAKTEWVISRVFYKKSNENKVNISGLMRVDSGGRIINQSIPESNHVHCFSNPVFPSELNPNPLLESQSNPIMHHQFPSDSPFSVCHHASLSGLIGTYGHGSQDTGVSSDKNTDNSSTFEKGKRGIEDQEAPSTSIGPVDLDCPWNYWNQ